jgi:hypothetical protein
VLRGFRRRARAMHGDIGARLRQGHGNRRAQPTRRAGNQSGLAFEIEFVFFLVFFVDQGNRVLSERCMLVTLPLCIMSEPLGGRDSRYWVSFKLS